MITAAITKTTTTTFHHHHQLLMPSPTTTATNIATNVVTWLQTHKWQAALCAALITPAIAILQAGFFLAQYRMNYRDAPAPIVPVHGVVVVSPWDDPENEDDEESKEENKEEKYDGLEQRENWEKASSRAGAASRPSLSSSNGSSSLDQTSLFSSRSSSSSSSSSLLKPIGRPNRPGGYKRRDPYALERIKAAASSTIDTTTTTTTTTTHPPPLRLLVIGDSVAAGVGVSESCAPVFPEVLAKTLSRAMGGRAVFWTCVGEAGASAAWVLRELEAQREDVGVDDTTLEDEDDDEIISEDEEDENERIKNSSSFHEKEYTFIENEEDLQDYKEWCHRLTHHKNTFNHNDYGQYDIAVVITGPNELKNGFLPFMVNGQDLELYKQARQKRQYLRNVKKGGTDLHLVIDALVHKMKIRFKDSMDRMRVSMETRLDNVKDSMDRMRTSVVESSMFDNVRDSMSNFRERIGQSSGGGNRTSSSSRQQQSSLFAMNVMDTVVVDNGVDVGEKRQRTTTLVTEESSLLSEYNVSDVENDSLAETTFQQQQEQFSFEGEETSEPPNVAIAVSEVVPQRPPHPLVILPGMPFRLLPMFRWLPLRWLAYILIHVMENIKRALSNAFPGTVIFAEAPGYDDIVAFEEQRGKLWEMRESTEKNVLLSLKSIPLEVCYKVESEMKEFNERIPVQRHWCGKGKNVFRTLISSDMVHPSDLGYDFFGRHVANVILEEWNKKNDN